MRNKLDVKPFRPLQVDVSGKSREEFEFALKVFKSIVQKEGILGEFKEKQRFEKPSVKKRRKSREAVQRRLAAEYKSQQIASGEWDKKMKKRLAKKGSKMSKRPNNE